MPNCQSRGRKWSWKDTISKVFKIKLRCPYCEEVQYLSTKSRIRASFLFLPALITPFLLSMFQLSYINVLGIDVVLLVLVTLFTPFIYKLSNDEEPLW